MPVQLNAGYMLMHRHLLRLARKHDVFVVTDDNPKVRHLPLPCKGIRLKDKSQNLLRRIAVRLGLEVLWILLEARNIKKKTKKIIKKYKPDLILTIWHSPFLLSAADLAKQIKVPYVVIIHDDWESMISKKQKFDQILKNKLEKTFQQASKRLCVGNSIKKIFQKKYGKRKCQILYPIPSEQIVESSSKTKPLSPLRLGFFGELGGNFEVLEFLADLLPHQDSTLTIFSHGENICRQNLAKKVGVFDGGCLSESQLYQYFQKKIDVIVIPQGFDKENAVLRKTCFPSKIPEACRLRLPLLVIAPNYGSANQWAKCCLPPECVISELNSEKIKSSIQYLKYKPNWDSARKKVSQAAEKFEPDKIQHILEKTLFEACKK